MKSKIGLAAINKTRPLLQHSAEKLRRALGRDNGTNAQPPHEPAHNIPPNFRANPEHAAGKQPVLIGTHHKTGTVWLESVFQMLCRYSGSQFVDINPEVNSAAERRSKLSDAACSDIRTFLYDHHSRFEGVNFRLCARLHVVRDPRDIIVSGMRYHMRSDESWLHQPDTRFDGLTYHQKLLSFSNDADRYRFEYENIAGSTIAEIEKIEQRGDFLTFRYEDLIADTGLERWRRLFESAGLEGDEIIVGLVAAWQNSLFGAMKPELSEHIHSGGSSRWISELPPGLAAEVSNTHKELISHLGY